MILKNEKGCDVPSLSSNNQEIYNIQELMQTNCDCQLRCTDCEICIHRYSCSCIDSSIKWNLCKHIHLVHKYRKAVGDFQQQGTAGKLVFDILLVFDIFDIGTVDSRWSSELSYRMNSYIFTFSAL